jgi:hypothetical protein
MENRITSYNKFYLFYLSEHSNKTCRILHFIGTALVFVFAFAAIYLRKPMLWWLVPIAGYSFAWFGHFFFEKNKPATFKYPLWSLASDFRMYFHLWSGKISFDNSKDKNVNP